MEVTKNNDDEDIPAARTGGRLKIRYLQAFLLFLAMLLASTYRVNMSIAIVDMTDENSENENAYDWDMQTQGVILSSFFWGYIVFQLPAGELAAKYGGRIFILITIAGNSVMLLIIPLATDYGDWQALCVCRVIQGLFQGFLYPVTNNLISKWVPLEEKGRLSTIIYAGSHLGTALQFLSSGFIIDYWGWEAIFYIGGIIGLIWSAFYYVFGADSPQKSKWISLDESVYIQKSLTHVSVISLHKKLKTPCLAIWTSLPFYSLLIVHCCQNWGLFTLLTQIPSYMKIILEVDIKANGAMSALPYLCLYILSFPCGFLSDYALKKKWVSISSARKISNSCGHLGPAIALIALTYVPPGRVTLSAVVICAVVGLNAGHFTGFLIVHLDMAPNFAGTLMGFTTFFANIMSIMGPLAAGQILQDSTDPTQWHKVFYLTSGLYFFGNTIFVLFGSCEVQPWNTPKEETR